MSWRTKIKACWAALKPKIKKWTMILAGLFLLLEFLGFALPYWMNWIKFAVFYAISAKVRRETRKKIKTAIEHIKEHHRMRK